MNTSSAGSLRIRPLSDWNEFLAAEELQRAVWQMPDWRDAVPANFLITALKNGGIVLGAFDAAHLVGLAFSFIALDRHFDPPLLKHHSHMLAVLPEYQGRRIGLELKWQQRDLALAQNIRLMTWTYDPLLGPNANLNLMRLGAIARRYIVNAYGEMTDGLNVGLPSDRFEVEWWLDAPRVRARRAAALPALADWDALVAGGARVVSLDEPEALAWDSHVEVLLVEIPPDLAALKAADPASALSWRRRTRAVFQSAFGAGFAATAFIPAAASDAATASLPSRAAYVLTRQPAGPPPV